MHYVFKMDKRLTSRFIYFRAAPEGLDPSDWRTGNPLARPPQEPTLMAKDETPTQLSDLLLAPEPFLICSPRLRDCLASAGVDTLEYFPVTLVDAKSGFTTHDYRLANVTASVACLDASRSDVETFPDSQDYSSVMEFHLDESRICPLPGKKRAPLLFRLDEFKFHLLADESVKAACEAAGITGIRFTATPDFA